MIKFPITTLIVCVKKKKTRTMLTSAPRKILVVTSISAALNRSQETSMDSFYTTLNYKAVSSEVSLLFFCQSQVPPDLCKAFIVLLGSETSLRLALLVGLS